MSDRRRSLLILLLVFGLIAASAVVVATKETKLGLDLQGGVQLVYEGQPTPQQPTVDQAGAGPRAADHARARRRVRRRRAGAALIGGNQVEVNLPGVEDADRAAEQVGSTAQLYFYDWEANILDAECRTNDTEVDGGQQPITGLRAAVVAGEQVHRRAEVRRQRRRRRRRASTPSTRSPSSRSRTRRAWTPREAALEAVDEKDRANAEILEVPEGVLVIRDEKGPVGEDGKEPPDPDRWWVIQDRPALSGTDIKNPEQNFDQQRRRPADRHVRLHGQGPQGVPGHHAPDRPARLGQHAAGRARPSRPRSTSRSSSTTSSSPRRSSTSRRTPTASTARPAPRSPAASRSPPPRTWRRSSRSARCRSSSS